MRSSVAPLPTVSSSAAITTVLNSSSNLIFSTQQQNQRPLITKIDTQDPVRI